MEVIFTTTNKYKIESAQSVLQKYNIHVLGESVDVDEIQNSDPEAVAIDKAKKCFEIIKKPLICMDSGLFIEGLKGFPGVITKYAIETIGEDGLINLTKNLQNKKAYVQRTIAYYDGRQLKVFQSRGYGEIISDKRGENGYSYDLILYVPSRGKTLAEMTSEEQVETWGDAWDKLGEWLSGK
jgi:XTP/dITP diphosphohydrolase